jgi:hypothetical protein
LRCLDIAERRVRAEDLDNGVILDTGEQADYVLLCGGVHSETLARDVRG